MARTAFGFVVVVGLLLGAAGAASAQVCVTIDETRDTLPAADRVAALALVARQFEAEGERIVPPGCARAFTLTHLRLLDTIVVTLTGPGGTREAVAQGSADLLAVYSQLVRSLLTGRPMSGLSVTDRTNVTETQASGLRLHSDSIWYAKVGYGGISGGKTYGAPAFGFGFRAEFDTYALDVSFFNFLLGDTSALEDGAYAHGIVKLSGLYFLSPDANASVYLGGGLGYGYLHFGRSAYDYATGGYQSDWRGNGLEGGLTVGYELARATSVRVFVQADVTLPFYQSESEIFSASRGLPDPPTIRSKYGSAFVLTVGVGR